MSGHRAQALAALDALRVRSATSYSWCGATSPPLAEQVASAMSPEVAREYLVHQIQLELYGNFYCRGFPVPAGRHPARRAPTVTSGFVERLASANHGRGMLQPGWRLRSEEEDQLVVERDGLSLWVTHPQIVAGELDGLVALRLPNEMRRASPGFYVSLGEVALSDLESQRLVRLYWHLTSGVAPKLLDLLTRSLNRLRVPFQLKVIDDSDRYDRCDAGVLYAPRERFAAIRPAVRDAYRTVAAELRPATPAFTKPLAPGLGLAEDPGDGQSFGLHRARLLADAAVMAHERGACSERERWTVLSEVFAAQGLDLERPYLSPGSSDRYTLEPA